MKTAITFIALTLLVPATGCVSREEKARQWTAAAQAEARQAAARYSAAKQEREEAAREADRLATIAANSESEHAAYLKRLSSGGVDPEKQKQLDERKRTWLAKVMAVLPAEQNKEVIYWVEESEGEFPDYRLKRTIHCNTGESVEVAGVPVPCGSIFVGNGGLGGYVIQDGGKVIQSYH